MKIETGVGDTFFGQRIIIRGNRRDLTRLAEMLNQSAVGRTTELHVAGNFGRGRGQVFVAITESDADVAQEQAQNL